jgi:hypothetical protein
MGNDMYQDHTEETVITAVEMREHLEELEAERSLAHLTGLAHVKTYRSDLEAEIRIGRHAYVGLAVTEIATLRAELFGPQVG